MKRVNKRVYAFMTAFLILFTTIFGNAFFVSKASEPMAVSAQITEDAATGEETVNTAESEETVSDEGGSKDTTSEESDAGKSDEAVSGENTSSDEAGAENTGDVTEETNSETESAVSETQEGTATEEAVTSENADSSTGDTTDDSSAAVSDEETPVAETADEEVSNEEDIDISESKAEGDSSNGDALFDGLGADSAVYSVEKEELTEAPANGDKVFLVITNKNGSVTCTTTYNEANKKEFNATTFTPGEDPGSSAVLFEVERDDTEGSFAFKDVNTGKYLRTTGETQNGLYFDENLSDIAKWTLSPNPKGTNGFNVYNLKASLSEKKLMLRRTGMRLGTEAYKEKNITENNFIVHFYRGEVLGSTEPETPEVPEMAKGTKITDLGALEKGVPFVISLASDNSVMTTKVVGTEPKLTLVATTGKLTNEGLLTVEKSEENAELVEQVALLTLNKTETEGQYTITTKVGEEVKYLTTSSTGAALKFADTADEYSLWNIEADSEAQTFHIINVNALFKEKKQAIECFKGAFTVYGYVKGDEKTNEANFTLNLFTEPEVTEKPAEPVASETNENTELKDGDTVVIWCKGNVLNSTVINSKYLGGTAKEVGEDGNLEIPTDAAVLSVEYDDAKAAFAFKNAEGKYLTTGATGGNLSFEDKGDYSLWIPEKAEGGFNLKNIKAVYNETTVQYLTYNAKYNDFTTSGLKSNDQFLIRFFNAEKPAPGIAVDETTTLEVASWGGNAVYEDDTEMVFGDLIDINDMLDKGSTFSAWVDGGKVKPFSTSKGKTGSTNYYMGAKGIGSGDNDFVQFKMKYAGYGNGKIAFRLRGSDTSADSYQLKYSTDGNTFEDFSTGKYSFNYTVYGSGGVQKGNITKTDEPIKNGVAPVSYGSTYISYEFDIPSGANNCEELTIRLVPSNKRVYTKKDKDDSSVSSSASLRVDSVKVTAHPVVSEGICGHVKADPAAGEANVNTAVTLSSATEGATIYYAFDDDPTNYQVYDSENKPVLAKLPCLLTTYATKEGLQNSIATRYRYTQQHVENVTAMPNGGAITENTQIKLSTKTEGATILYAYAKEENNKDSNANNEGTGENAEKVEDQNEADTLTDDVKAKYDWIEYTEPFTAKELPCEIVTYATKEGCADSAVKTLSFKKRLNEKYNIYFGQIHSHTNFSDGAGSCEEAFKHASTEVANLDYLAVTDHSNSLDHEKESVISKNVDTAATDEWTRGHELAKQYSSDTFTCIYGYEMTWSNGLGHMNTYNTPGFQSRTQTAYSTYSTALQSYYAALNTVPDSVSMFNHPGTTFGDFQDFAYYSEANDELINLIEVGNGEGEIGSSGYFPSYEYYTRALDKGWHIAPTNNQDNHKGRWGDANTARTVALADANTELDIYDAMRNHRIYATEDNDLSIYYTLDGNIMGTILGKDAVGEKVHIVADVKDPTDGAIGKVSVIVNGGLAAATQNVDSSEGKVEFDIDANYSYYYLRIDQKDGNIAVTAPVWVGDVEACGINGVSTTTTLPVRGENLDINVEFYNNEKVPLEIEKITIDVKNAQGIETNVATLEGDAVKDVASIAQNSTAKLTYNHVYQNAGKAIYTVTAYGKLGGIDKVYSGKLEVNYTDPQMVGEVVIDGSHYNDYVGGYYAGNMNNFIKLCAEQNLRAKIVSEKVTAETLKGAKFFVIAPPASKSGEANGIKYTKSTYDDEFVNVVKEYVAGGGTVIITGIADYNNATAAREQNKLLTAIGSTITVNSDECIDEVKNGGQVYRLYPENFKADSPYLAGVKEGQKYSQYSGCSISFTEGENDSVYEAEKLVWGFESTYSKDCKDENGKKLGDDENGIALDNKGDVNFLVHQKTKAGGDIFVAGGVFISDFEVKAEMDNNDSLPYLNYNIAKNIIAANQVELPVSKIADMRQGAHGDIFAVEGYVTAGTENEGNKFFDTIYIQDDTAGVTVFPVSETGIALGTKVRITGFVDDYQGDLEIQAYSYKILDDEKNVIEPKVVSTKDAADYELYGGSLLKTSGVVTRVVTNNAGVDYFFVKDETGVEARVFIDGYILSSSGNDKINEIIKEGATVSAVGLSYMNPDGATLRVRDRDEIVLITASSSDEPAPAPGGSSSPEPGSSSSSEEGGSSSSEAGSSSSSEGGSGQSSEPENNANAGNGASVDRTAESGSESGASVEQNKDTKSENGQVSENSKNSDTKKNSKSSKKNSGKKTKSEGNKTNSGSSNRNDAASSSTQSSENVQTENSSSAASTNTVNSSAVKSEVAPAEAEAPASESVVAKADTSNKEVKEADASKNTEEVTEASKDDEAVSDTKVTETETSETVENAEENAVTEETDVAEASDEQVTEEATEIPDEEAPLADTIQGEKSGIPMPVLAIILLICIAAVTGGAMVLVKKQNVEK